MRKFISFILIIFCLTTTLYGCQNNTNANNGSLDLIELNYEEIKDKLVRFHVIANSDTDEDQALKLKVRDRVIDFLSDKLQDAKTLEEAKKILADNINSVNEVAKGVINENNYAYDVNTMLSHENFPDKVYGDYLFPQGNYEAFRVIIGEGRGQNWWCVMFPPLCFLDESKNSVDSTELKANIDEVITDDTTTDKNNNKNDSVEVSKNKENNADKENKNENKSPKIVFKSKIVEIVSDLFN